MTPATEERYAPEPPPPSPLLRLQGQGGGRWQCHVFPHLCVGAGRPFLFGGTTFAACIEAMERSFAQPVSLASAQFIAFARPDEELILDTRLVAGGQRTSQIQASASAGDRLVASVQAALGRRDNDTTFPGKPAPTVPPPEDCAPTSVARLLSSNMNNLVEVRLAAGQLPGREPWAGPVSGPLLFWARARDGSAVSRQLLAVFADFLSIGIPAALGRNASGSSLDNHIRFVMPPEGEWVLCAIEIEAVRDGLVHGHMRQYGREGQLLALAGQSMILRLHDSQTGKTGG